MSVCVPPTYHLLASPHSFRSALTRGNVQADGARIEVLEVGEGRAVLRTELKSDGMTGRAAKCSDRIAVTRSDGKSAEVLGYAGRIGVGCCQGGRAAKLGEVDGAAAGERKT